MEGEAEMVVVCVKISVNQAWLSVHAVGDVLTAFTGGSPHLFTFNPYIPTAPLN